MRWKPPHAVVHLLRICVILSGVMVWASGGSADAAEFAVTNTNDSGAGSLRQAMLNSNSSAGADVIRFQNDLGGTITLASELPIIVESVTVQGPTAAAVTVSGNDAHRVFFVHAPGENVQINDLSISGGRAKGGKGGGGGQSDGNNGSGGGGAGLGGGLLVTAGSVSVSDVAFLNNNATGGNGGAPNAQSWAGNGGGGGLGGDGGEGDGPYGAGGGGIGESARGGDSEYGPGNPGGDGLLSTSNRAGSSYHGYLGGMMGGGGGGSSASEAGRSAGGGGGDGGQDGAEYNGGNGGFGGGGGGSTSGNSSNGGAGGFAGGGGGGFYNGIGGDGGFGGGGGGSKVDTDNAGSGGFGGGDGNGNFGGGGLGAGGAVFVRNGASLTINYSKNLAFSGNTVTAGSGGGTAQDGSAIGQAIFLGNNTQLNVGAGQEVTISESIGGSASGSTETDGGLIKGGAGTLILSGANTYVGGTTVSDGTLAGNSSSLQGNIDNNAVVEFMQSSDGTYADNMSGSGAMIKSGAGRLTLSGSNTHSGGTTVSAGTLMGSTSNLQGNIANNAAVEFAQASDGTYAGNMSGNGSLTKTGNGRLTLSGSNNYGGGTTVSGGTLAGSTTNLQGNIANNAAIEFAQASDGTYAGNMSGSGSLTKTGSGRLTLSGSNNYSGGTTVSGGTLAGSTTNLQGNITNNAAIEFTQASDGTYTGNMSGSGSLTKSGAGRLTLSGSNTYTGPTNVSVGGLILNGTAASNYAIYQGARFGGNGTVANLNNSGTVAPGNSIGTTIVTGNYVHDASAVYEVEINNSGQSDLIDVSGTATINGGTVDVQPEAGTFTPGSRYTILEADGGVSGTFDVLTGSVTGARLQLFYNANNVELFLAPLYYAVARTPNQKAVATVLEQMALSPAGDVGIVLGQLDSVVDTPGSEIYFDQLSGEVFGTTAAVGIENTSLFLNSVSRRLRTMNGFETAKSCGSARIDAANASDLFGGESLRDQSNSQDRRAGSCWRPWVQGYGISANARGNGNASGFNYGIGGTMVGMDRALDYRTRFGLVGGYGNSRIGISGPAQRAFVDSGQFALYLQRRYCCRYLTGIFSYAHNNYDTSRQLAFGNLVRTAAANYDGNEYSFYLETGRMFRWGAVQFQPYGALQYIGLHSSAFTETGAASMNLAVNGKRTNSMRGMLGSRLIWYDRSVAGRVSAPELRAFWRHEFLDEEPLVGTGFVGAPASLFVINGAGLGRDAAMLGGGYSIYFGDRLSVFANYDILLNSVEVAHVGTGGLQFVW